MDKCFNFDRHGHSNYTVCTARQYHDNCRIRFGRNADHRNDFYTIVLDMGFGAALIQKENISERQLSTLYWLNILTGILLFIGLFFLSPFIADFYQRDELVFLVRILAVMFLIAPVGQQYQYMLQKI